jgi:PAS domain S-box-containing protein
LNFLEEHNEEEYQSIFENATEGIFQSTIEGHFLKVNPAMARIFGYETPEDMVKSVTNISRDIHLEETQKQFVEELTKHGYVEGFEAINYRKDRSVIWTRTNARAVRDERGNILYFEGFLADITSRKETELALQKSEQRYRALVERLPGTVFLDAPDNSEETFYVSPKIEAILGYSPDEWISMVSWSDIIHPEDRERILAEDKRTDETRESFQQEYRIRKKDGEFVWIREETSLVKDDNGKPLFWQGFFLDISNQKQAEHAIHQSEQQFKKIFHANPIASFIATLEEGRFIAANDAYWNLSGFKPNEILGQTSVELGLLSKEDRKKLVERLLKEKSLRNESGKIITKSGETRNTLEFFDLIGFDGQDCVLSMLYDITEQVKAQEALRENEEKHRQLFEAESDAIFLIENESGNILEANAAATALYGYDKQELLHKKNSDLSAEPEETRKVTRKTPIIREQVISIPIRYHKKKDGTIFPVEITGRFFEWRGRPVHIAAIRDITERKKAEEALKASEERFRLAFQTSPDSININRLEDGLFVDINEGFTTITGYTREEVIGKTSQEINIWNDQNDRAKLVEGLQKNGYVDNMEARFRMKDGRILTGLMSAKIIMLDEVPHTLSITREIETFKRTEETLQRQLNELTILHNVALAASSSKSVDELIQRVTDTIGDILYPDNCGVELLTESGDMLVPHPSYRGETSDSARWSMHISQGVTGKVATTGTPIRLGNVSQEPAYVEATAGVQSELCVPVKIQDRVIGVLNVESKKTDAFSESDERLLNTIAGTMASAIEQLRLFETSQRRLQELTILNEVSLASTDATDINELIENITQIIGESLYPDNFGVLLLDGEGKALYPHSSYRGITNGKFPTSIPLNHGVSGQVAATGKSLRIANVRKHKDYIEVTSQVRSELCVPIVHRNRIYGVINAESLTINAFTDNDERLLTTIASTLATAIEKLRLIESEKKRRQEAEILREATAALTTTIELEALYKIILDSLEKLVPYDSASIELVNQDYFEIVAEKYLPKEYHFAGQKHAYQSNKWKTRENKHWPLIIPDVQADERFEGMEGTEYIRSWMGVPMIARDNLIGYLNLDSSKVDFYTQDHAAIAQTFGNQVAIAIENARLFETEQRRHRESETLRQTAEAITSSLDIRQVLNAILNNLSRVVPFDSAALFLIEGDMVRLTAGVGFPDNDKVIDAIFPASNALLQEVWETGKPLILEDAQADPRFEKWAAADQVRGWMGVPLAARGEMVGCITVDNYKPGAYTEHDSTLAITFAYQAAAAIDNARLFERSEQQIRQLTVLRDIDSAIASSFDLRVTLDFIVNHAVKELNADAATILLYNPDLEALSIHTQTGFANKQNAPSTYVSIGEDLSGQVALERKLVQIPDLSDLPAYKNSALVKEEGFKSYFGIPLIGKGQVKGVLEIYVRTIIKPSTDWLNLLHMLAGQAAIAIDNVELFKNLHRSNLELTLAYDTTLAGWGRALELRDKETQGHTNRVVKLTVELARRMGVTGEELTHIMRGTLLHDIGKMGIPDNVLNKPGTLTEEEWDIMRQHPQYAYDLIYPISYLRPAVEIPYGHHERWDGSGYPLGLKGKEIPLAARIFAVVDIYDALLNERVYREAWPEEKVVEYLKNAAGIELDPAIVEVFLEIIQEDHYKYQAE